MASIGQFVNSSSGGNVAGWVAWDMVTGTILDSFNVTSVTDNAGDFIINWTTPMATENYALVIGFDQPSGSTRNAGRQVANTTTTSRIATYSAGASADFSYVCVAAFES